MVVNADGFRSTSWSLAAASRPGTPPSGHETTHTLFHRAGRPLHPIRRFIWSVGRVGSQWQVVLPCDLLFLELDSTLV